STGSACSTKSLEASHVLLALGMSHEMAHGSLRFSLGKHTKEKDISRLMKVLPGIVKKLRDMSPIKVEIANNG
ncbi:MAG: cysteine desulfurase NifS, partial [DPANN group archaeon]|nr:cysteine desulfurase NifS [DPANN group archaeon]